mgnify:CR=1 FL=1
MTGLWQAEPVEQRRVSQGGRRVRNKEEAKEEFARGGKKIWEEEMLACQQVHLAKFDAPTFERGGALQAFPFPNIPPRGAPRHRTPPLWLTFDRRKK